MILRDALDIRRGTAQRNKIYKGTYKVWDRNKIALEGYCKQNTTKGKQLLESIATTDISQGVEFIQNKNGTVTINGKNNGTGNSYFHLGNITLPAGTYYGIKKQEGVQLVVYVAGNYYDLSEVNLTLAEQKTTTDIYLQVKNNQKTYDNFIFYPMIANQNITIDDFEPYTGGQPSPNPNYPQEIEVMQGRQVVNIKSRNLIGIGTQLNGFRNLDTNRFNSNANSVGYYFSTELLPDTITFNCVGGNRANISYYNEIPAQGVESLQYSNSNIVPRTITVDKNYKYIHIQLSYNILDISKIQLEEGTEATPWVPYKNEQYTVDLKSKNELKLEFSNDSNTVAGLEFTHTDSTFSLKGTATGTYKIFDLKNNLPFEIGEKHIISANIKGICPRMIITLYIYDDDNNSVFTRRLLNGTSAPVEITKEYSRMTFVIEGLTNGAEYDCEVEVQVEKGNTATPYEPHYDYKLAGIGNYKDNFYTDKGKWYFKQNIKKHDLIGQMAGAGVNNVFFTTEINDYALADNIPYSNRFKGISNVNGAGALTNADDNVISFINSTDYRRFYIKSTKFTDYNAINEFLTNNKTYLYYLLRQPIITEVPSTYTTLINQLNALYQAM